MTKKDKTLKIKTSMLCISGGLNPDIIRKINSFHPEIVIVGGYIANSRNQRDALEEIHQAMDSR